MWQEWAADGAISAVLVRDFGPGGGDPGEKCFTLTPTGSEGITTAVFWGQKGNSGQNEEREGSPVGLKITRDVSSYEIHAPFDVWDGHVDGERRWCAEFSQTISSR